jgi:hypothetical protein
MTNKLDFTPFEDLFDHLETLRTWEELRKVLRDLYTYIEKQPRAEARSLFLILAWMITEQTCRGDATDVEIVVARIKHQWEITLKPFLKNEKEKARGG